MRNPNRNLIRTAGMTVLAAMLASSSIAAGQSPATAPLHVMAAGERKPS